MSGIGEALPNVEIELFVGQHLKTSQAEILMGAYEIINDWV